MYRKYRIVESIASSVSQYESYRDQVYRYTPTNESDIIMSTMASQITSVSIVCSAVCSGKDQRKHQSPTSLAFVRGIHRLHSPHKGSVTQKLFPFDDIIMSIAHECILTIWWFLKIPNSRTLPWHCQCAALCVPLCRGPGHEHDPIVGCLVGRPDHALAVVWCHSGSSTDCAQSHETHGWPEWEK